MTTGRFHVQLFAKTATTAVSWRLLTGNNRESGRGALAHSDAETCRIAIKELQRDLPYLERRVRRAEPNRWTWELRTGEGVTVAVSGHAFDRLIRCERAGEQFVEGLAAAPIAVTVLYTAARRWGSAAS